MRTFRVDIAMDHDDGSVSSVSTEVIVGDDDDIEDAGEDAAKALTAFLTGYARGAE